MMLSGPVDFKVLLPLLCGEPAVLSVVLEGDSLTGRSFHNEPGEGQGAFQSARLMSRHEDTVPAAAVSLAVGLVRVVGLVRAPGECATLGALALLQDEVAAPDRDGVLLHADDGGREVGCADVGDGADACVVGVSEVPDRLDAAAAPESFPCPHTAGCLGAQLRLVAQHDAVGTADAYVEAGVPVGGP
jgi:hypothetical protein